MATSLGLPTPNTARLTDEILNDFALAAPYGVGWWAPHPGTSRRILISDQLYACAASVTTNLVEAGLHRLEYLDYIAQESDHLADVLALDSRGEPRVTMPRSQNAIDDSLHMMADLHIAGVARALSGALDCLSGVVVGVLGLPTNILKSDLDKTRRMLRRLASDNSVGREKQIDAGIQIEAFIRASGPEGWMPWLLAFRNMIIHRGRRLFISQLAPRIPVLHGPDGRPIPRMNVVRQLPRDAGRSDIEVLLDAQSPVLTEPSTRTIDGAIESTREFTERTTELMLAVWKWRRANPMELRQPREQWPDGPGAQEARFCGYAEGTAPYNPGQLTSHPVLGLRLKAASLPDSVRHQWTQFD